MLIYLGIIILSYLYGSKYLENFCRGGYGIEGIEEILGVHKKSFSVHKNCYVSLSSGLHLRVKIIVGQQSTSSTDKKLCFFILNLSNCGQNIHLMKLHMGLAEMIGKASIQMNYSLVIPSQRAVTIDLPHSQNLGK